MERWYVCVCVCVRREKVVFFFLFVGHLPCEETEVGDVHLVEWSAEDDEPNGEEGERDAAGVKEEHAYVWGCTCEHGLLSSRKGYVLPGGTRSCSA